MWSVARGVGLAVALSLGAACAGVHGQYVWVDDYAAPAVAPPGEYAIGVGDLVNVQVWDNDKISTKQRVRSDGQISVPLLGDVPCATKTPQGLARDLERRLHDANLVVTPRVNVSVDEMKAVTISVLGAVQKTGNYVLEPGSGLAQAIASAGGLTEFAHKDRIFVLRQTPQPVRIRFTFAAVSSGTGEAGTFRLQNGDVVVAE